MLEFNPNKKPGAIEYATYVPSRTTAPTFKMHKQRNHALAAIVDPSILYKFIDGEWVEIFRLEKYEQKSSCEECGTDLIKTYERLNAGPYSYNQGIRKWKDTNTNKPYILWVCRDCKRKR